MNNIRLKILGLPLIQSIDDFSEITHISNYTIYQLSKNSSSYYRTYFIKKKNGKKREIAQPNRQLKSLQSWILRNILDRLTVSGSSKGFEKNTSIADNAIMHIGANTLLNIDLKDFFNSIERERVYNIFYSLGYNKLISTILTNLCVYENYLPQGSPCSPKLANLCCWNLDNRIQGYVGKKGINYTRYADDMSFSGLNPHKVINIVPYIKFIINDEGFQINSKKTRISGASRAKTVTGLVLYDNSFGIGKYKYKLLRAQIFELTKVEGKSAIERIKYIEGYLNFMNSVDKKRLGKIQSYIEKLKIKYPNNLNFEILKKIHPITILDIVSNLKQAEEKLKLKKN